MSTEEPQVRAADMQSIRDVATKAMTMIEFHMVECDKRQQRIEKSQDETKTGVANVDSKLERHNLTMSAKVDANQKEISTKLESYAKDSTKKFEDFSASNATKFEETNKKIISLQLKIAFILGGLQAIIEIIHLVFSRG